MITSSATTSPNHRVIFDENFGTPHIERLKQYIAGQPGLDALVLHTLDFQQRGVWDEHWIPEKAREGWIIISQDRGKNGWKKGEPLPRVCVRHRATHVLLSAAMQKRKMAEKIQLVLSVWPTILTLHAEPRGSRFSLALRPDGIQSRLINRTSKEIIDAAVAEGMYTPKPQKDHLFNPEDQSG